MSSDSEHATLLMDMALVFAISQDKKFYVEFQTEDLVLNLPNQDLRGLLYASSEPTHTKDAHQHFMETTTQRLNGFVDIIRFRTPINYRFMLTIIQNCY